MKNWIKQLVSVVVLGTFMVLAISSSDYDDVEYWPCEDEALLEAEPIPDDGGHTITYQVKVVDKATNNPIPDITVEVYVTAYNCQITPQCPNECYMNNSFDEKGYFIGLTDASGIIKHTTSNWTALDKKDRVYLNITLKDESLLVYAYKRKNVVVGQDETQYSITIPMIEDII